MLTLTVSWSYDEYKSKNLSEDSTYSYEENSKDIHKKNFFSGQLYINSLTNKFNLLAKKIEVISETKLDESFPAGQFRTPGYVSPLRLNRDQHGG